MLHDSADRDSSKGSKECDTSDNEDDREKAETKDNTFFLWLWFRLSWFNNRFYRFDDWLNRLNWFNDGLYWFYDWLGWFHDWLNDGLDRLHWLYNRFNWLNGFSWLWLFNVG